MWQCLVVQYTMKHQKYVAVSSCTVHDETSEIWWQYLHISDVSSCTLQLDTHIYFWCFIVYTTTRYSHVFVMFHRVLYNYILAHISDVSSCTVYSCNVHGEASEICVSILLYSTRWNIRNMVAVSSFIVHEQTLDICDVSSCTVQLDTGTYFWCFIVYCTHRYWHMSLVFHRVLYN
jgi:hypothetical protein